MKRGAKQSGVCFGLAGLVVILSLISNGCDRDSNIKNPAGENMLLRDINEVLSDHDDALMAIEGVVGVAVGLMEDGKTLCLKVLVARKTPELVRRIPASIEGHPVVVEESGVIQPF
jgi:hypothetical protein